MFCADSSRANKAAFQMVQQRPCPGEGRGGCSGSRQIGRFWNYVVLISSSAESSRIMGRVS